MRLVALSFVVTLLSLAATPAFAQVPVNDAERTGTETNTAVCMRRARTFKQSTVSPTRDIHGSVTGSNDTGGMRAVAGGTVVGAPLSGSTISGNDFAVLMAVASTVQAIKSKNVGQAISALAAVASAISANGQTLSAQSQTIGQANTLKGAFEQNGITRLTNAQIWNQAIQAISTTVQLRNQRLLDMSAAASATAKTGAYDPSKTMLTEPEHKERQ
ncbi:UNVERIFIED_ORG: stage V sporulation protein SpoVS [Agrobacterium larrymoorei]|uniref:Type VI secretion protein n=2 Tax=Rhizobium/Agrobacterium group TaxID=227290 RepID=A0AA92BZ39_RHIRH|nr:MULTISPECIES: hypothetical protein [Rhizobium/Agrobacterium group]MDP9573835.1 stage V sporulation protein SpoVS [Agrobacterium larrymoorei]PVE62578.1 hypothetical protein DC415_21685 [Agrobacterium tumefaciens]PVE70716.1 hypothetical protein DCP16_21685 [Sphingomonas sp. TPD3009]PVE50161.1 hypothetical protein DC430_22530 [Rhizobium rhizogenes]TBN14908.1 hypothetical protein EYC79_07255 [Agrobacterium cavarae]